MDLESTGSTVKKDSRQKACLNLLLGFKKVSDDLKLTVEENVGLAEKLRTVTSQQEEESAKIENLLYINKELNEVNQTLENKICKLDMKIAELQEMSIVSQEDEDSDDMEEEEEAGNLSLGWDGLPPDYDDHSSIGHIIDNLQREISTSEVSSSVSAEDEEIREDPRDSEPSISQNDSYTPIEDEDVPNPNAIINNYAGKILLDKMEDWRQSMKEKTDSETQKGTFTSLEALENFNEKIQKKMKKDDPVLEQPKDISKEEEIRNLVRSARELVPHLSNRQWNAIEQKVIEKYLKSNIVIKASHFAEFIKPVILKYAEKQDDRSSLLLEQIEFVTNQVKSERALLNFKEQIREICRESKHLFSAKNYERVEGKIVDHYSKAQVLEINDKHKQKITDLLVKLSKKYVQ